MLNLANIVVTTSTRGQTTWTNEGEGRVAQMTTTINNSYLIKCVHIERGVKITQNSVHVVYKRPLFKQKKPKMKLQIRIIIPTELISKNLKLIS